MEEYGLEMARVAKTLFGAMAACLGLEQEQRDDCLWEESGMVRVHRYPRCTAAGRVLGMDAHTDSSLISILNLDDVPGLQFLKDGQWVSLLHSPNTLVVNLGDMMQVGPLIDEVNSRHQNSIYAEQVLLKNICGYVQDLIVCTCMHVV